MNRAPTGMTPAKVAERAVSMLELRVSPHGFKRLATTQGKSVASGMSFAFMRELAEGRQFIQVTIGSGRTGLYAIFSSGGQIDRAHEILLRALPERCNLSVWPCPEDYSIFFPRTRVFEEWSQSPIYKATWADRAGGELIIREPGGLFMEEAVESLLDAVVAAYVPPFDKIGDLRGIATECIPGPGQNLQPEIESWLNNRLTALVAGHLVRDPNLPQFIDMLNTTAANSSAPERIKKNNIDRIHQLVNYLQANVAADP